MLKTDYVDQDSWLRPYRQKIEEQRLYIAHAKRKLLSGGSLNDVSLGHLYFGLHKTDLGWVFREWAPNAKAIYILCDKSGWKRNKDFSLRLITNGQWEIELPNEVLKHGDHYKLLVEWQGGSGERLPSYTRYAVQDENTHIFDAVVWQPEEPYKWRNQAPKLTGSPLIYETHVGMSGEKPEVASYVYFRNEILPRIKELGYNTVQIMALQEHPYYGSFGYHVSNFFAASSRFGTPDDLKSLIDTAHGLGLRVIMDMVHSHAVRNEAEGLSRFDGTLTQYFHEGNRGHHIAWDSRVFDYGKDEVKHFLLSNLHFWLDEYKLDGFRFDGVTSMLYLDHGLGKSFVSYDDYYSDNTDIDAVTYLQLACELVRHVNPNATMVAEDMSGFPGLAAPVSAGGVGFDYRLSMGMPDLWIKLLKEQKDEDWDLGHIFHELTSHRVEEKTISYAESHDQALVGDKTLIFRLADKEMYYHMMTSDDNLVVSRAIALHKMIRLITASTNSGGYLNFMGNEFGHPEWIDFPREGNDWSYQHARRQWSLVDDKKLKYHWLNEFDKAMIGIVSQINEVEIEYVSVDNDRKLISFQRGDFLFVFNFSADTSYHDHEFSGKDGDYSIILSSDNKKFGGQNLVDESLSYPSIANKIKLYIPSRSALVFQKVS